MLFPRDCIYDMEANCFDVGSIPSRRLEGSKKRRAKMATWLECLSVDPKVAGSFPATASSSFKRSCFSYFLIV